MTKTFKLPKFPKNKRSKEDKKCIFEKIKKYSEYCGYELLSTEYINSLTSLTWKSKDGTIFTNRIGNIKHFGWPNIENIKHKNKTSEQKLKDLKEYVQKRGGKILSNEYIDSKSPILCEDIGGNTFKITPNNIKNGHWSPYEKYISEHLCRQIFEQYFEIKFPQRWDVIKYNDNIKLQLDGYAENVYLNNKIYNLAFEYKGYSTHINNLKTIIYDNYKKEYCEKNNIKLFVIDKINFNVTDEEKFNSHIYSYIKNILKEDAPSFKKIKLNFKILNHNIERLNFWKNEGQKDGYELLSTEYITATHPLEWKSPKGIIFKRSAQTICGKNKWPSFSKHSLSFMKTKKEFFEYIKKFGKDYYFELLSTEYVNSYELLIWKSPKGVIFKRSWATIRKDGFPSFNNISMAIIKKNNEKITK